MFKKSRRSKKENVKTLDMDASMQGKLVFRDPVDLKISGKFEGSLDTKGNLTIGEGAVVNAEITGENMDEIRKKAEEERAEDEMIVMKYWE